MSNKRRSFLKKLLASSAVAGALPAFARPQKPIPGRFAHVVFFWLKEPDNQKAIETFEKGTRDFLSKVDVIRTIHLGTPAGTPREVVDNSYSVCLIVTFDTKEDQDIYQAHEAHLKYIEDMNHMWTRVQVYDSWGFS